MTEKLNFLNRKKSYPLNTRYSNNYLNRNDKILLNQNNNYLSCDTNNVNDNNLYMDDDINQLKDIETQKMNNIHIYQSINNRYNNKINFDTKESTKLQKEYISLYVSLKQIERESKLKDVEIDGYKLKMKALIKQIKRKNKNLNKSQNIILKLCEEQKINQNFMDINNDIMLSNNKLIKYKNRNVELLKKIKEKNYALSLERKKFMKLQNDYIRIREDSKDKENQFKNRINNNFINKINDKIIKFFNKRKTLIIGGFYDGKIEIIYLEEKEQVLIIIEIVIIISLQIQD